MTIRLRLACLFTAVTLVLLVCGGFLFVTGLKSGLNASLDRALQSRAADISAQTRREPADLGSAPLHRRAPLTSANGIIAELLAPDGSVLRASRALGDAPLISPSRVLEARRHGLIFDAMVELRLDRDPGREPMRLLARAGARRGTVVVVAISRDVVDKAVSRAAHQLIILGIVVSLLVGPGAWLLARAALRPVERMRRAVSGFRAGDDAELPVPKTRDEIGRLAETFNGLLSRLNAAVARERAFVGDAGHELRTPLTILKGELELSRRTGRSVEELTETLDVVAEETERLVRLTEDLLLFSVQADSDTDVGTTYDLVGVARQAVYAVAPIARPRAVALTVDAPPSLLASGNPDDVRRAIENLLTNAVRFSPPEGMVKVAVVDDVSTMRVVVSDDGPGFPVGFIDHAFERFARADAARGRDAAQTDHHGGSGLGLAIVHAIMTRQGGYASARNIPGGGAALTLTFPIRVDDA